MTGRELSCLDEYQGDEDEQDQTKNNIGIPGAMQEAAQLPGTEEGAANREDDQRKQNQNNKSIQNGCENRIISDQGKRAIEGPKHQIEQAKLDNNKAPERKKVGNARNGVAQDTTLSQHDLEELANAVFKMIGAVLRSRLCQQRNQLSCAQAKQDQRRQKYHNKGGCPDPSPRR